MTPPLSPLPADDDGADLHASSPDRAGRAPVGEAVRPLRRLAELFREASEILAELASNQDIQLAGAGNPRLMDDVETAPAEPSSGTSLLTVDDLAEKLKVASRTVRRWRGEGKLPPAIEFGGLLRWRPEVIDAWIAEREEDR